MPHPKITRFLQLSLGAHQLPRLVPGEVDDKVNYSTKRLGGYLLAFFMVLGIASIASTTAQAQYPGGYGQDRRDRDYRRNDDYQNDRYRNDRYGRNNGYNQYQIAREQGYRDGLATGASDAQHGQSFDPQRSHYWKNGTDGYNSSYGNRGQYKQMFRDAFAQGYREGYSRYGGYNRGNNGRWGNGRSGNGRWPW